MNRSSGQPRPSKSANRRFSSSDPSASGKLLPLTSAWHGQYQDSLGNTTMYTVPGHAYKDSCSSTADLLFATSVEDARLTTLQKPNQKSTSNSAMPTKVIAHTPASTHREHRPEWFGVQSEPTNMASPSIQNNGRTSAKAHQRLTTK